MVLLVLLVCALQISAAYTSVNGPTISFASSYGSHMVLHRSPKRATVWGYTSLDGIGEKVTISLSKSENVIWKQNVPVVIDTDIRNLIWEASLPATEAGGPYTVRADLGDESVELSDIFFGDIWMCSGQSNMEVSVDYTFNYTEEIAGASSYPKLRLYTIGRAHSKEPLDDVSAIKHAWTRPTSEVVAKYSSLCWSFGRKLHEHLGIPIGLVSTSWGGTRIEAWSSPEALLECGIVPEVTGDENAPSALWNAMIHPVLKMTISGTIWYQGEWNARANDNTYDCRFPSMISDWRRKFRLSTNGQTDTLLPFGFVQLAAESPDMSKIGRFPLLRWMQTSNYGYTPNEQMPATFMAVAMDLPDFESPIGPNHPRDKSTISSRLLLGAKHVAYGEYEVDFNGPLPSLYKFTPVDQKLQLYFGSEGNIEIRNNTGFEVCCADELISDPCSEMDRRWSPANITGLDQFQSLSLTTELCKEDEDIVGLRYSWRTTPCPYKECAVYRTNEGLPAPPFIFEKLFKGDGHWHEIDFE